MGNSNVIHRILVNTAINTELNPINCVKSSADSNDFSKIEIKSETNIVSLHKNIYYINMKSPIQIKKIKAVLLYIMQSFPNGVDYIKLFKILYFAQQDHLVKYGKVIVDESFKALKHGPVPTYTYKALQVAEGKPLDGDFKDFLSDIEIRDKKVYTTAIPDMDYISGANKKCLDTSIEKYQDKDPYDLSDMSHDSAWEEANARIKDDPQKNFITIIDIARAGKATETMVDYIREKQLIKNALSC